MDGKNLSRREFLQFAVLSAASVGLAACQPNTPEPTPTAIPTPTQEPTLMPTSTPPEPVNVKILGGNADVWSWRAHVRGTVSRKDAPAIQIEENGQLYKAVQDGLDFTAELPVQQGENKITAISGEASSPPVIYTGRLARRPIARISISIEDDLLLLDGTKSEPAHEGKAILEYCWSPRLDNPGKLSYLDANSGVSMEFIKGRVAPSMQIKPPSLDGEYYFSLQVTDRDGLTDSSQIYAVAQKGAWIIPQYDTENPQFVENTIVYGVIPRKFGKLGFYSIIQRLDDLKDLGINAIWLSPINVSPMGDYGYAVMDYFNLATDKGSKGDFHQLVQEAHDRGIRVLMDFVPNHTSDKHPYYQDTLKDGKDSPYWTFYDRDETGAATHYFDWTNLPNLNYSNPDVRRFMLEAFSYWVREFDVDGFRTDACWGVKQRYPEFWPEWRRELKRIKPDLLLLAEASARDPYYFEKGFDAAYDWTDQLGKWAWEKLWKDKDLIPYNLEMALTDNRQGYHEDALVFRFLNNNDTNIRFISTYGPGLTRAATALLLTLPGIPCVYTGDEYGEEFRPYYDPHPLEWKEREPGLRDYHKKLITLRKDIPSLHSRFWQLLDPAPHTQAFGYLRFLEDKSSPVLVLLNFMSTDAEVSVTLPGEFASLAQSGSLKDLLNDQVLPIKGMDPFVMPLPGMSAAILVPYAD